MTYVLWRIYISRISIEQTRECLARSPIIFIAQVSVRYGEVFHEPKASEMSCNISRETSVIGDLSYTDGKCAHTVEH